LLDAFLEFLGSVEAILWGPWTMAFIAFVSIFFTVRTGFFQVRGLGYIWRQTVGRMTRSSVEVRPGARTGATAGGGTTAEQGAAAGTDARRQTMTPFQAAATSLAGTVGMGNMAGVATALSVGGPGAILWMWVLAFFGMMSKTAEITLGVHYRVRDTDGRLRGGPMHTIRRGLGWTPPAVLFSVGMPINAVFASSLLQSHTVGRALLASYGFNPYVVTGTMAVITASVVLGGVRRIGRFSGLMVPIMSLVYLGGALVVVVVNAERIPWAFGAIFTEAFSPAAGLGGVAGVAVSEVIKQGMSRGMLSNEAGLGTAPMVHATANTEHPFQQGVWGAFEVFVDTIVICTITALAILSTGALASGESGIELLLAAFVASMPEGAAALIISVSIATFCLSTQIGFFVYFETTLVSLVGTRAFRYLRWFYFLPAVVFAGVADVDRLWALASICVAVVAIPNLIAMIALSGVFKTLMDDELSGRRLYATANIDGTDAVMSPGK